MRAGVEIFHISRLREPQSNSKHEGHSPTPEKLTLFFVEFESTWVG